MGANHLRLLADHPLVEVPEYIGAVAAVGPGADHDRPQARALSRSLVGTAGSFWRNQRRPTLQRRCAALTRLANGLKE
jgi:hypothetical protein